MQMIIADVETTGVTPNDKIVEVSLIEVDADLNVVATLTSHINPGMPIPPGASAIHHVTDTMVASAPTEEQFFRGLSGLRNQPVIFVAHNAPFDWQFLGKHFHPDCVILDTLRLVRHLYPTPAVDNHKLQTLRYTFNLDAGRAHSADGDTLTLVSLLKYVAQDQGLTIDQMIQIAKAPMVTTTSPFGNHKGVAVSALPKQYVKWALENMNLDSDHRAALEAVK